MKGSTRQLRNGQYQGLYPYRNPVTGRWSARSAGVADTEREAWRLVRKKIGEIEANGAPPNRVTIGDICARWLTTARDKGLAHNTLVSYEQSVRLYLVPLIGKRQAQGFDIKAAEDFRHLLVQKYTSARANRTMRHLSQALQYGVRAELLTRNVANVVGLPSHTPKRQGWYTLEDWRRLEQAAREYAPQQYAGTVVPWGPRLMASLLTGLRQGQLSGLHWSDLDRYGKLVVRDVSEYRRGYGRRGAGRVLKEQHNDKGEPRLVDVPLKLLPWLETQRAWWRQRKLEAQSLPWFHDLDLIFPDAWGRPPSTAMYHRHFVAIMRAAGLEPIRPHDLRRSFASVMAFELGEDLAVVSRLLGHKNTTTTIRYLGAAPEQESAAINRLSNAL